jgi:hypothetical protein
MNENRRKNCNVLINTDINPCKIKFYFLFYCLDTKGTVLISKIKIKKNQKYF